MAREFSSVGVVGLGTMGTGITEVFARSGIDVVAVEVNEAALERGRAALTGSTDRAVARGKLTPDERDGLLARVRFAAGLDALADADLVIEAVPEDLRLKQGVFRDAEAAAPEHAVLATNTSSLSVSAISSALKRPGRVVGMHFFNPPHLLKLLEVFRGDRTAPETLAVAVAAARRMGKEPIVVKDSPGFASSRLGLVLGLEAIRMVEAGVASAEDIDKAMELGYNHPMGPLKLTDLVGLDVRLAIAKYLHQELASEAFRPPALLERMVAEGRLGRKTGQGFYAYPDQR